MCVCGSVSQSSSTAVGFFLGLVAWVCETEVEREREFACLCLCVYVPMCLCDHVFVFMCLCLCTCVCVLLHMCISGSVSQSSAAQPSVSFSLIRLSHITHTPSSRVCVMRERE